ncbi:uncharacterized protein LOC111012988 isoform X2 [Momordica charantia]|nr:uncharacterized protein LOC111012988 isoform X2 [Momordica charantia]
MEKMAKASHAKFVLHIREPGENDRLMKNGTRYFSSLKVPWHGIQTSRGNDRGYFIERMKLQYGQTLDIVAIDTGLLQESLAMGSASDMVNNRLHWLKRTLQTSNSNWRIVVGFHPLVTCEDNTRLVETKHLFESIHQIFVEHRVNAYLSRRGCAHNIRIGSTAYIGFPGPIQTNYFTSQRSTLREFLLHRVSLLETVFYYVNTAGEVVHRTELQQKGRKVI